MWGWWRMTGSQARAVVQGGTSVTSTYAAPGRGVEVAGGGGRELDALAPCDREE